MRQARPQPILVISVTFAGMALGGWMAGAIYDRTGSYASALVNGIAWNVANIVIAAWLLQRERGRAVSLPPSQPCERQRGIGEVKAADRVMAR